jgi:hypothetical protein
MDELVAGLDRLGYDIRLDGELFGFLSEVWSGRICRVARAVLYALLACLRI